MDVTVTKTIEIQDLPSQLNKPIQLTFNTISHEQTGLRLSSKLALTADDLRFIANNLDKYTSVKNQD